jgi:hypothetical protein
VVHKGDIVTARAITPQYPVTTSPTQGQAIVPGQPLQFTWTSNVNPDWWNIVLVYRSNGVPSAISDSLPPSARAGAIPTSTIPAGSNNIFAYVYAVFTGTFTGPVDLASSMRFQGPGGAVGLTLGP